MDITDQEFSELVAGVKKLAISVVRPLALAFVAYILGYTQGHFSYPNLAFAMLVFVFAASTYAVRLAYALVFYLGGTADASKMLRFLLPGP